MIKNFVRKYLLITAVAALVVVGSVAYASHSWGSYHWARTSNPFTLKLGDNVSSQWDSHLATASYDWSLSSVLDTVVVPGQSRKNCRATLGQVEVCNSKYGNNGWLGIAQIWVSGDHIVQGVVKMNDTYFNTAKYNTPSWRSLVVCQEIAHTMGLDHQDEIFDNPNLGTCMDYTSNPLGNEHPNLHDYEELEAIYAHLDTTTTVSAASVSRGANPDLSEPGEWGKEVRNGGDNHPSLYARDLGNGQKVFTFVIWAE